MEDLTKYVADVIEFLVGGVLFLGAILLYVVLFEPVPLQFDLQDLSEMPNSIAAALVAAIVAVAYALGVVAEGLSRVATEWRLQQITLKAYRTPDADPSADLDVLVDRMIVTGHRIWTRCTECQVAKRRYAAVRESSETTVMPPSLQEHLSDRHREALTRRAEVRSVEQRRERQRKAAEGSALGAKAVSGQLKRLRIERTFLLSITLTTILLIIAHLYWLALLSGLLFATAAFLVDERFRRYVQTISLHAGAEI